VTKRVDALEAPRRTGGEMEFDEGKFQKFEVEDDMRGWQEVRLRSRSIV
jgi:hypothetical protein